MRFSGDCFAVQIPCAVYISSNIQAGYIAACVKVAFNVSAVYVAACVKIAPNISAVYVAVGAEFGSDVAAVYIAVGAEISTDVFAVYSVAGADSSGNVSVDICAAPDFYLQRKTFCGVGRQRNIFFRGAIIAPQKAFCRGIAARGARRRPEVRPSRPLPTHARAENLRMYETNPRYP